MKKKVPHPSGQKGRFIEVDVLDEPAGSSLPLPCIHRGDPPIPTGKSVDCSTCTGKVSLKVFACAAHPEGCTLAKRVLGKACCDAACRERIAYFPDNSNGLNAQADAFLRNLVPYPADHFSGRGVVIVGGGKYWPSVYVTVRMLRHVGCALPVQVWHLGQPERSDRYRDLLEPLGVECVDAVTHPEAMKTRGLTGFPDALKRHGPKHPPFEAKSFAVLHSPFAEVLYLDADNYPCVDPTALFDEPGYLATGGVYWPDVPSSEEWTKWDQWGVPPFGQKCGLEVGQYLFDKRKAWKPLNLARWYDDHGDTVYGWGHHHGHGDKEPHRVAWAKLRMPYTMYSTVANWNGLAFLQPGPDGLPMFVHRCLCKITLDPDAGFTSSPQKAPNARIDLPLEDVAFGFLEELRRAMV